ncbi:amidohydrolase [Pseudomonas sp. Teo4]|uniref:amidohydrolase n=1 Tax=Pseudomonas sp. Teo4 TaxID=3064528 RepID=UPI002AB9DB13|nr:amidohydrolase [Pseudomonas sp. Teo4]MDZ3992415.1 N-acetylcysteine deacetylase [Pseudomonas sp. Teo4]
MKTMKKLFVGALLVAGGSAASAAEQDAWVKDAALKVQDEVVQLRRQFHQYPELGNQEFATAKRVADYLRQHGIEVRTGVARTGVVGILKGGKPGPVMALRADMDALPVAENTGLPFASTVTADYQGKPSPVMHACGHDTHTAMLLGAARLLAEHRQDIAGTVVFVFQPAEEGAADLDNFTQGAEVGARKMIAEGVLDNPKVQVMFGLHVVAGIPSGELRYRPGALMNSADGLRIDLQGTQAHGSMPWKGHDPVVAGAQIINGLQTLVSRRADLSQGMGVVSIGSLHAGIAPNVIPDSLNMLGTIRTSDDGIRKTLLDDLPGMVEHLASANGVQAKVQLSEYAPVLMNAPKLTKAMIPALQRASDGKAALLPQSFAASEDFAHYANRVPSLFVLLGATTPGTDMAKAPINHSPFFTVDESTFSTGVRAHVEFVLNYPALASKAG